MADKSETSKEVEEVKEEKKESAPKKKTSKRIYHVKLPFKLPGWQMMFVRGAIDDSGLVPRLPKDLQNILGNAETNSTDLIITEKMCDEIDDDTWKEIASLLHISWENVPKQ